MFGRFQSRSLTSRDIVIVQRETDETRHNVDTFVNAESLAAAKPNLKKVRLMLSSSSHFCDSFIPHQVIGSRFTEKYLQTRYTSAYAARTGSTPSSSLYPAIPTRPGSAPSPSGSPSSPPRKVVSEFKPFAASSGLSMANTALGANVEEDMTDESKGIELKFSSISLEQVSTLPFAFLACLFPSPARLTTCSLPDRPSG